MDALTSLVTALAAGAAAALKPTVEQAVKDSYTALKGLIQRKYGQVSLDQLEANPSSKSRRGVVEEDIAAAGTDKDAEVLQRGQAPLEAIKNHTPEAAAAMGVDLKDIEGASLAIRRVTPTGAGVKVERAKLSGDITVEDVQAGDRGAPPKPIGVATQEPNGVCSQTSLCLCSDSLRISWSSCSYSLRMSSHSGENNSQTSVSTHIQ
jgi:hypothetical protein